MVTFHFCGTDGHVRRYCVEPDSNGTLHIWYGDVPITKPNNLLKGAAAVALQGSPSTCDVIDITDYL